MKQQYRFTLENVKTINGQHRLYMEKEEMRIWEKFNNADTTFRADIVAIIERTMIAANIWSVEPCSI